ncbi:MAG: hypothetical protein FWF03_00325 [Defluviitaleaceae bacterium]|nr:hypothetical protein [Defluviitaleaceae bacterium]
MKRFVPRDKLSKKARKELYGKERGSWGGVNPVTKILESKKLYDRKKARMAFDRNDPGFRPYRPKINHRGAA